MAQPLLAFKAGRSHRRDGTNHVVADVTKGAVYLFNEDGLLQFRWKNRVSGAMDEACRVPVLLKIYATDHTHFQGLILFPQDASFSKVSQCPTGRTYVLKFSSSNEKHFVCVLADAKRCLANLLYA